MYQPANIFVGIYTAYIGRETDRQIERETDRQVEREII